MFYLIPTPIGNLGDLTYRAQEVMQECAYLLCEDTRHSRRLLNAYNIDVPLKSYHKFNEASRIEHVLADLKRGLHIGLLSDAGTPTISDPGERLVAACHEAGLPVSPLPGPCAAITALSASGLPCARFQFLGFLTKKKEKRKKVLAEALAYPGTTIFYESPHRIVSTLEMLAELDPTRTVVIARELTKKFETIVRGTPEELAALTLKGEIVVML